MSEVTVQWQHFCKKRNQYLAMPTSLDCMDCGARAPRQLPECRAKRTADPPQDCNWPLCGCDPYADRVIGALLECGWNPPSPAARSTARTSSGEAMRTDAQGYEYLGDFSATPPWFSVSMQCDNCKVSWTGCWDNYQCPRCGEGELPDSASGAGKP